MLEMESLKVMSKLLPNWKRVVPSDSGNVFCTFYHDLLKSLFRHTNVWRGNVSLSKLLIPRVSLDDETSNKGSFNVVMPFLLHHGDAEAFASEGKHSYLKGIRLAQDCKSCYAMIVGDGLSQVYVKTFERMIEESS